MDETLETLRITGFVEQELTASANVDGIVTVYLRTSRPLTKFENDYNESLGDQSLDIATFDQAVVLEDIEVSKIRDWVSKVNRVLELIESEAGTAHRRYIRNRGDARRELLAIDFDTII